MKKAVLFGFAFVMALSVIAGCQSGGEGDDPNAPQATTGDTPDPNANNAPAGDASAGGPAPEASNQPQYNPSGTIPNTGGGGN